MDLIKEWIAGFGIIPVIKIGDPQDALPLARALADGGLPLMEITFRTGAAAESIRVISKEMPGILVGAGTVLTPEQAESAYDAGARFIVSPGFNPRVVRRCRELELAVIPGVATPGEMEQAMELGLDLLKFFPAGHAGGPGYLKAVGAPYPGLGFIPTGGINAANLNDYLALPNVVACGGSWMATEKLISDRDFKTITDLTKQAVSRMLGFELAHVGLYFDGEDEPVESAKMLCAMFGLEYGEERTSVFCGNLFECVKGTGEGARAHVAVSTNSVPRAITHLKHRGVEFDERTTEYSPDGKVRSIFLKRVFAGVRIQIVGK